MQWSVQTLFETASVKFPNFSAPVRSLSTTTSLIHYPETFQLENFIKIFSNTFIVLLSSEANQRDQTRCSGPAL